MVQQQNLQFNYPNSKLEDHQFFQYQQNDAPKINNSINSKDKFICLDDNDQ